MGICLDMIHGFLKGTKALPVPLIVQQLQRVDLYIKRSGSYFYVRRRESSSKAVHWGPFSSQKDAIVYRDFHMEAYRTDGTLPPQPPLLEGFRYMPNWNRRYAAIDPNDWLIDYFCDEMNKPLDDWFNGDSSLAEKE